MLSCHRQKLILCTITQLTLPISHTIFWHHRRTPCCKGILGFDFRRSITRSNKIIQFLRTLGIPLCLVHTKCHSTNGRIVPKETISSAGYIKRNARLGIAVSQLQNLTLFIQVLLLILSHTEYLLIIKGFKTCSEFKIIGSHDRL